MNYETLFKGAIDSLKKEGRYRVFADLERRVGESPHAYFRGPNGTKKVTVWCSNDYLGMSHNPVVVDAMKQELDDHGAGAGGTRNISGNHHTIVELEAELAALHQKDSALVFSSGYVANQTALCTLGSVFPNAVILSDADNHASMIEGIRHSRAEKHVFNHSDVEHLDSILKTIDKKRPKIVAFESVYSMNGDIAPLEEMIAVIKKHGALSYIDETHAVGLYGAHGGGVVEKRGLLDSVDCLQGGLGKGYGVVGGFITGSRHLIDVVRSYGAGFIFTTTMPPVVAAGALASIRYLKAHDRERKEMMERVASVRAALLKATLPILETDSHIIPLMVGDSVKCKRISDILMERFDIYIQPINFPTVPRGTERLRITPSPKHTDAMTQHLVESLNEIWSELEMKKAA